MSVKVVKNPLWKNVATAAALVGFVGGVYVYTYSKMKTNEIVDVAKELEEYRESRKLIESIGAPATESRTPVAEPGQRLR